MKHFLCCLILACFVNALAATTEAPPDLQRFVSDGIVPDVLDQAPTELASVKYGDLEVNMGNVLTPTQVKKAPSVNYTASPDKFYTLIMVDPDAPSRVTPLYREWLHWRVVNIPGNNVLKGQTLTAYRGSGPPRGTGLHRYVFVVFEHPEGKITFDEPILSADQKSADDRGKFAIRKFAQKHSLGNPLAGNFFQAKWEPAAFDSSND